MKNSSEKCNCTANTSGITLGVVIALGILVVINTIGAFVTKQKVNELYQIQLGQIGGSEVLKEISEQLWDTQAFKDYQKEATTNYLSQMKEMIGAQGGQATDNTQGAETPTNTQTKEIDAATLEALTKDNYYLGNPEGDILIVTYADFLCGYCKRLHDDNTLKQIVEENDNVGIVFKQVALFGEQSVPGAKAAYCIQKAEKPDQYWKALDKGFENQIQDEAGALALAKEVGVKESDFTACYQDAATTDSVHAIYSEGAAKFGISGTPATVVINKTSGKYELIG